MTFQKLLVDVSAMVEKVNGEKARMASVNESMIKNLGGDLDEILKDERTGERLKPDNIKKVNVHLSTLTMSREDTFNTLAKDIKALWDACGIDVNNDFALKVRDMGKLQLSTLDAVREEIKRLKGDKEEKEVSERSERALRKTIIHTRDESREMATDIMATSTTKLTLFTQFFWLAFIRFALASLKMHLSSLGAGASFGVHKGQDWGAVGSDGL